MNWPTERQKLERLMAYAEQHFEEVPTRAYVRDLQFCFKRIEELEKELAECRSGSPVGAAEGGREQ